MTFTHYKKAPPSKMSHGRLAACAPLRFRGTPLRSGGESSEEKMKTVVMGDSTWLTASAKTGGGKHGTFALGE